MKSYINEKNQLIIKNDADLLAEVDGMNLDNVEIPADIKRPTLDNLATAYERANSLGMGDDRIENLKIYAKLRAQVVEQYE